MALASDNEALTPDTFSSFMLCEDKVFTVLELVTDFGSLEGSSSGERGLGAVLARVDFLGTMDIVPVARNHCEETCRKVIRSHNFKAALIQWWVCQVCA